MIGTSVLSAGSIVAFGAANVLSSFAVFVIVFYKLVWRRKHFTWIETIGMGMLAAGCIMTIGPITHKPSPFDDWSVAMFRVGCAVYFIGRLTRHRVNNWSQRNAARKHLEQRRS